MKTSKTILLCGAAAIAAAALLTGCTKGSFSHSGELIRFASATRGAASTKTAYGAVVTTGDKTMQALDWKDGDVITVASAQAEVQNVGGNASNYVVKVTSTGSEADVKSYGTVTNESENGLMWTEAKDYVFYAVYPKVSTAVSLTAAGAVSATIPAEQALTGETTTKTVGEGESAITYKIYQPDMANAFMTARTAITVSGSADEAPKVPLEFTPAFTAFEFNVSSQDDEIELTQFQLLSPEDRGDKLAGTFTMTAGDVTTAAASAGTASVTVPMTEKITAAEGLSFTVFTVPVINNDALRIRFTSKDGEDATKTSWVDLKYSNSEAAGANAGKALQFQAGHKYRINMLKLPSNQWKISITAVFEEWVEAEDEVVIYI